MTGKTARNILADPSIFMEDGVVESIRENGNDIWQKHLQPEWPQKDIKFIPNDRSMRRRLISALVDNTASAEVENLGYRLFKCSADAPCRSPLCNYCRTKLQDRYQARVLRYFKDTKQQDIAWITILDDITTEPLDYVPDRRVHLKRKIKDVFEKSPVLKSCSAFGAFEIDVRKAEHIEDKEQAVELLKLYGMEDETDIMYMPHFHLIVDLNGATKDDLRREMRAVFQRSKQIKVSGLHTNKTKTENLKNLARYCYKFRYQFSDNILADKPSYGARFDDETMRIYAELVHSMINGRGTRQYELSYNLSS